MQALKEMKTGKAPGHSDLSLEYNFANRELGIQVTVELCQESRKNGHTS